MKNTFVLATVILLSAIAVHAEVCIDDNPEVLPVLSESVRVEYDKKLAEAKSDFERDPKNVDAVIWLGRRTAYLGAYKRSIEIFSDGIAQHPGDARLYRHRGHRYLTLRCFNDAAADLEKAANLLKGKPDEIEPDGLPNARNIPTSTLQSNIWYHLGLTYYLRGEFKKALNAYKEAEKVSKNNDMRVATAYWHYMTLRRLGKEKEAGRVLQPFGGEIELIENTDYLKLIKLNRGETKAAELLASIGSGSDSLSSASLGYGIGNYFLYNGQRDKAVEVFRRITAGDQWSSFGYIAAETELSRMGLPK
jgi:tetratricopeptide (TPR) repeat protein